jgi:ketosteroid isomerase-like protein
LHLPAVTFLRAPDDPEEGAVAQQEHVDNIKRAYQAFAKRDYKAVFEFLDPDITMHVPDLQKTKWRGHSDLQNYFECLSGSFDSLEISPEEFIEAGPYVIVRGEHRGTVNGANFSAPFAHFWTMRGGKAVQLQEYMNPGAELTQAFARG